MFEFFRGIGNIELSVGAGLVVSRVLVDNLGRPLGSTCVGGGFMVGARG